MAYVKLLNLLQAVREIPAFPRLDEVEEKLLVLAANALQAGAPLTVLGAMGSVPGISPSTVHRRLKQLSSKGMIEVGAREDDARVKHIVLTPLAGKYFSALSECVEKSIRA